MTTRIDTIMAGNELDELVAERVMGWKHRQGDTFCERPFVSCPVCLATFSHDIEAAWQIVEKFRRGHNTPGKDPVACVIEMHVSDCVDPEDCSCKIYSPAMADVEAFANTMPLAICRAALKAVGVRDG